MGVKKEKLLVRSNFFFIQQRFQKILLQTRKKTWLVCERVNESGIQSPNGPRSYTVLMVLECRVLMVLECRVLMVPECRVLMVLECRVLMVPERRVLMVLECRVLMVPECRVLMVLECRVLRGVDFKIEPSRVSKTGQLALSTTRRHSTNTPLSNLDILGTEPD